jgi:response regulator of citrate/malate metabolism
MATLNLDILDAAHADGLLPKRLTKNQTLYLHPTAQTANQIYWAIADAEQGLNLEQLQKITQLHSNTLAQYTRWFIANRLIYAESYGQAGQNVYFSKKRHKRA